jgi:two-component system sensor histidine kinase BaeS
MFNSIRWRLVISYMLLTLMIVSAVGLLALVAVQRYAEQQEIASLTANAETIARQAAPLLEASPSTVELNQLSQAASFFGNLRVRIYDNYGELLADSGNPGEQDQAILFILSGMPGFPHNDWIVGLAPAQPAGGTDELFALLENLPPGASVTAIRRVLGPWGSRFSFSEIESPAELRALQQEVVEVPEPRSQRTVSVPVNAGGRLLGQVELSAGTDFGAEALASTRQGLLLAGAAAVVLAGVLGFVMGNRLSAPLVDLTETAGRMSAGDLSVRAPVESRDEIGRLAAQFNRMAEQLQASFSQLEAERDTLRRFIADASHELRTPITALRNFNELLQGTAAKDPAAREEFLRESQVQIERLAWITQNLLDLSRLDAGLAGLEIQSHDLGEIMETASVAFRGAALEKGILLETLRQEGPILVQCDRARLEIVLSNLLDNALKFTPSGGKVEIGAAEAGQSWRLWVRDGGAGIPEADLPHIFERFYRGKNRQGQGSGLGLSIVASILAAHGWQIQASNTPPGATFTIHP